MNFNLSQIPERVAKTRSSGLTVVSDKGLSLAEVSYLIDSAAPYIDLVKLAFGTALFAPQLRQKIELYKSNNIRVFLGGLLFEAFVIRNQVEDFEQILKDYDISYVEVSDGAINISQEQKLQYISRFSEYGTVISEIGSKDKDKVLVTPPYKWIQLMQAELDAGSAYVIAEAKESGTVGIYRDSGEVREGLIQEILTKIPADRIIWEAPEKHQQLYFIKLIGANVNLGNIAPNEVIALEAMRLGLRGDSFDFYLDSV